MLLPDWDVGLLMMLLRACSSNPASNAAPGLEAWTSSDTAFSSEILGSLDAALDPKLQECYLFNRCVSLLVTTTLPNFHFSESLDSQTL